MNSTVILHVVQYKTKKWTLLFSVCSPYEFSINRVQLDLKMTNQKSLKKSRIQRVAVGLDRSCSLILVFLVFPTSPTEVLIHSWFSQVLIQGEAGQCSMTSVCNKVTGTQHLSRKNQYTSNCGPWHERSSTKGAGNGIFKESNMLEEN